ncbi:aminobenzoyl-glutamate utilization protein A [Selenomonas sp. WCT3]|nr:aminobenzoyl-glutamate utilization protein A [Selenomonas ruminantium]
MQTMIEAIKTAVKDMQGKMVSCRRDIHKHPEPGWTEFRTASLVAERLSELGYELKLGEAAIDRNMMMGVPSAEKLAEEMQRAEKEGAKKEWLMQMTGGLTGIVAVKKFSEDGPVVALRFDMDANDVQESRASNHFPQQEGFCSLHGQAMHACGHDGHTTVGLAVAEILVAQQDKLKGTIKLVFQPAEEGVRGARAMVENDDVDDVNFMLGAHFGFQMKHTGTIACNVTGFLATSKYDIHFVGKPAHAGAAPEQGKNALLAAACAALNLHAIPRHSHGASRINVGKLIAGSGRNVVADKAFMAIETRGASSEINSFIEQEALRIIKAAAAMYDVDVQIEKTGGAAGGSNSPELAAFLETKAKELDIFTTVAGQRDFGASEDFSYFMERVQNHGGKAAYMMIGADLAAGHHDSSFDFDEKAMGYAANMLAYSAVSLLLQGEEI